MLGRDRMSHVQVGRRLEKRRLREGSRESLRDLENQVSSESGIESTQKCRVGWGYVEQSVVSSNSAQTVGQLQQGNSVP